MQIPTSDELQRNIVTGAPRYDSPSHKQQETAETAETAETVLAVGAALGGSLSYGFDGPCEPALRAELEAKGYEVEDEWYPADERGPKSCYVFVSPK
jgi:hypothetical protein